MGRPSYENREVIIMGYSPKQVELATRIAEGDQHGEREVFIDPATIMVICAILSAIFNGVRVWIEWRRAKQDVEKFKEKCTKKPFFFRWWMFRIVRKEYPHKTRKEVNQLSDNIMDNIANTETNQLMDMLTD